ncbi:hypothetical protein [Streptomyces sp. NBC_01800]|uniref:hypothetical protein n=1 Tax=Streptomyces sp. NBC_01800 TaxID=2975945 RepID=UPI002DD847C4|nr:hypothetical protein [Streptomyces sp. NBC_01800]WSA65560.1 hypothetical protein OIE65_00020 [Streptomyces sp. NBC_01800]WSA73557.1 hypothetical protein OIE65_46040 [Streptomyces sp. NBC_01800]
MLSMLPTLINATATLAALTGAFYTAGVASVAAVSVLSRNPGRRRDARETLKILRRRRTR